MTSTKLSGLLPLTLKLLSFVMASSVLNFKVIVSPIVAFVESAVLFDEIVTLDILAYSAIIVTALAFDVVSTVCE